MEWSWCNKKGDPQKEPSDFQLDKVGNILQKHGGVVPKACQECKVEFKSTVIPKEITKESFGFKCSNCKFKTLHSDGAFEHMIEKDHKMKKEKVKVLETIDKIVTGHVSHIKHLDNDCIILCGDCLNKS